MEPRGIRNCNPCNIRRGSNWQGLRPVQTDSQFCQFESMQMGARAALKLILNYVTGWNGKRPKYNTVRKIIYRWAPTNENNSLKYSVFVARKTGINLDSIITSKDYKSIIRICWAMAWYENGKQVNIEIFESAWLML